MDRKNPLLDGNSLHRAKCDLSEVREALEAGMDPNTEWADHVLVEPIPQSGCRIPVFALPWESEEIWNTPLHKSLHHGHRDAAAFLLQHGAHVDQQNKMGRTPLHEAVDSSDFNGVELLLEHGADVNAVSEARATRDHDGVCRSIAGILPIHYAIRHWNHKMVETLLSAGANVDQTCPGGWTILDLALLEGNETIIEALIQRNAQLSEAGMDDIPLSQEALQETAARLLGNTDMFPPQYLRRAYSHAMMELEFIEAWKHAASVRPTSRSACYELHSTLFKLLSHTAGKPDPKNVSGAPLCSQCVSWTKYLRPSNGDSFPLFPDYQSLEQSARSGCCLCAVFEDALLHGTGHDSRIWHERGKNNGQMLTHEFVSDASSAVYVSASYFKDFGRIGVTVLSGRRRESLEIYRLSESHILDHTKFPDDVQLGTGSSRAFAAARAWLDSCSCYHVHCSTINLKGKPLPTRVIDVASGSQDPYLCSGSGTNAPYLALSYCWGGSDNLKTTKSKISKHMDGIPLHSLPPTLRDAVLATRELGFRFLWIDSLCIVQDDADDWNREAAQMQAVYANAALTLSAVDSKDTLEGLFRPRGEGIVTPVQVSLRMPKNFRGYWPRLGHQAYDYVFPVRSEKDILKPGPLHTRGWTYQEQLLSTRILHFAPGMLHWECLSTCGAEADPDGSSLAYARDQARSSYVLERKRVVHGLHEPSFETSEHDISYDDDNDEEEEENHDKLDKIASIDTTPSLESYRRRIQAIDHEETHKENTGTYDHLTFHESIAVGMKWAGRIYRRSGRAYDEWQGLFQKADFAYRDQDARSTSYLEWQRLVSEYSSRALTKLTDKIPAFLGISQFMATSIRDRFMAGIWTDHFFFASILWQVKTPEHASRNSNYPSWSWASINGVVQYPSEQRSVCWEPSDFSHDIRTSGPAQNRVSGSISMKSVLKQLPKDFDFWGTPIFKHQAGVHTHPDSAGWTWGLEGNYQKTMPIDFSRDMNIAAAVSDTTIRHIDVYCIVIGRVLKEPPPRWGYPVYPEGTPRSLLCLCLVPVEGDATPENTEEPRMFRRVGLCRFWDTPGFWDGTEKDKWITIV